MLTNNTGDVDSKSDVHKIPARVQCTEQVCEMAVSNLDPQPYRSRQIICLSHSESVRLPLQLPMRPSPHQLHAGPLHPLHACTARQHTSSHTVRCARLVHLCSKAFWRWYITLGIAGFLDLCIVRYCSWRWLMLALSKGHDNRSSFQNVVFSRV
jgi:hypothetical protein